MTVGLTLTLIGVIIVGLLGLREYVDHRRRKAKGVALMDLSKEFEALVKFNEKQRVATAKNKALLAASNVIKKANAQARVNVNLADYLDNVDRIDN